LSKGKNMKILDYPSISVYLILKFGERVLIIRQKNGLSGSE
jgi:hypothetical protein